MYWHLQIHISMHRWQNFHVWFWQLLQQSGGLVWTLQAPLCSKIDVSGSAIFSILLLLFIYLFFLSFS
jgi:hypothetical protein